MTAARPRKGVRITIGRIGVSTTYRCAGTLLRKHEMLLGACPSLTPNQQYTSQRIYLPHRPANFPANGLSDTNQSTPHQPTHPPLRNQPPKLPIEPQPTPTQSTTAPTHRPTLPSVNQHQPTHSLSDHHCAYCTFSKCYNLYYVPQSFFSPDNRAGRDSGNTRLRLGASG